MNLLPLDAAFASARKEALRETGLLDTPPEAQFDRFTRLVCRWLDVPIALVSLVDTDRQFFKSARGLGEGPDALRSTPLSHSICRLVVEDAALLAIDDARLNPRVCDHPAVSELGVGAYLGAPLITPEGVVLGSLCAIDRQPRVWSEDDRATLVDLAALVMTEINIRTAEARRVSALEAEVARRTASLRQALIEMEEFSHMISHDLRAPLRRIKCYAEILVEDLAPRLTPAEKESLNRIAKSALGMEELLNAVLPILRLARMDLSPEPVDLDGVLRRTIAAHAELLGLGGSIVVRPLGPVLGQAALLESVFAHLLRNAAKFVPAGVRPEIEVSAEADGDQLRIWVRDNGIGIAPEYQTKIFGVFSRLHAEAAYPGHGLGLNTVSRMIRRLNGTVGVVANGSRGSAFWVRLPRAPGKPA